MRDEFSNSNLSELDRKGRIVKVVDFRLPLWGALWSVGAVVIFIAWSAITIWFQVQQLNTNVSNLQVLITSGNNSVASINSDIALLKFRESNLEDVVKHNSDNIDRLRK